MVTRRRCSECRCSFHPSPRSLATQQVCSAECRAARDRKLARARRRLDIDEYRADERERQQAFRQRRAKPQAAVAPDPAPCHAPASASKSSESLEEVIRFVAGAFEASRATLLRDLSQMTRQISEILATARQVSRASFGVQVPDSTAQFNPDRGGRHA